MQPEGGVPFWGRILLRGDTVEIPVDGIMTDATLRFLGRFVYPAQDPAHEREVSFDVAGRRRSATLYLPEQTGRACPAWIVLQGVTVLGRHHDTVRRLARSLAAAGHVAVAPEMPSWTDLRVDPRDAEPTVRAALALLGEHPEIDRSRVGLMGLSVAGTWALEVAAGEVGRRLRAVVALGAYGDFRRMVHGMMIGQHEWRGRHYQYMPDPYGRWILAATVLPHAEDDTFGSREARDDVASALHRLALTSGRNGAAGGSPVYDPLITELRERVPADARAAWDLLAPTSEHLVPDSDGGRRLADVLTDAGLRLYPEMDPRGRLGGLDGEVILLHGRSDTLVPFTETPRLAALLPARTHSHLTITRLIGHSRTSEARALWNPRVTVLEARKLVGVMRRIVDSVEG